MPTKAWAIPRDLWKDQPAVVIGTGWSLTREDCLYAKASGARTLVVNRSYQMLPDADWLHACDGSFWQDHNEAYRFEGIKTTLDAGLAGRGGLRWLRRGPTEGFDDRPEFVATGLNSGYQAIVCAIKAGASAIVLLGFDMCVSPKGESHWWRGGYQIRSTPNFPEFAKVFPTILPTLDQRGIDIVNASPGCSPDFRVFVQAPLRDCL
jgi:hypothetical protein